MIERPAAERLAAAWLAAWNRHDLEAILAHYAEEVTFASPFVAKLTGDASGTLRGKTALRAYFAQGLATYPQLHFTQHAVLVGADSVTLLYASVNGLLAAETMVLDAAQHVVAARCHYAPATDPLAPLLGQPVVVDTDTDYTYIGTLAGLDERVLRLTGVALYDRHEARVPREKYLIECAAYGIGAAREEVLVQRSRLVALSPLAGIVIPAGTQRQ
jgi:ketosteroid isomerase-like protein